MLAPITGKIDLEENCENLPVILQNIISNPPEKKKLMQLISNILPFIKDIDIDTFVDKSLTFKIKETFSSSNFPALLLSDGTINITALIIALYFEHDHFSIFEEPERNIHPHLISRVYDFFKDVSKNNKQILITTHNPEFIKDSNLEDILFISRDKEGYSTINRPEESEKVKQFLKNEIGINYLFINDLLGE